jgi:hypothetical protein
MPKHEIHVEQLVGRRVIDVNGRSAGRIEEIRAARHDGRVEVREYLLGPAGLFTRLLDSVTSLPFLNALSRLGLMAPRYRVPWDKIDLEDPTRPRVSCTKEELRAAQE